MSTTRTRDEKQSGDQGTFGSGLGPDFKPLGKRILVPKGIDSKPLKVTLQRPLKENES